EPSCHFTPGRSLKRQVTGSICCQETASSGTRLSFLSRPTRNSYTRWLTLLVRPSFCECGSVVCGSPRLAQRSVLAFTGPAASVAAMRASVSRRNMIIFLPKLKNPHHNAAHERVEQE